jgi:hypothetical protein
MLNASCHYILQQNLLRLNVLNSLSWSVKLVPMHWTAPDSFHCTPAGKYIDNVSLLLERHADIVSAIARRRCTGHFRGLSLGHSLDLKEHEASPLTLTSINNHLD